MGKVPFTFEKHLIYIPAVITHEGRSLRFDRCIVDTGSAGTTFEAEKAEQIGLVPGPESKIRSIAAVGGRESVYTRTVDLVEIAGEQVADFEIEIGDLQTAFGIDGIIGNSLLRSFRLEICYRTSELVLWTS